MTDQLDPPASSASFTRDDLPAINDFFEGWDRWRALHGLPPATQTAFFDKVASELEAAHVAKRQTPEAPSA